MDALQANAIEITNVTKTFGPVVANDNVCLNVRRGEILALLGENGSGKTTLMNMLSGIYYPDNGSIKVNGAEVVIRDPKDAFALGIGMIHQHFKLVDVLTAAENIVLGLAGSHLLDRDKLAGEIGAISRQYGFEIDHQKKIYDMSISEKQSVEIVKVLYRGADILILDEPTAVLTPQETEKLFDILRAMKGHDRAIIIITHKLNEVLAISDRVSILRKGKCIGTLETAQATRASLTEAMVGRPVSLAIERPQCETDERLRVESLSHTNRDGVKTLSAISFGLRAGEILGVAGIAGSGQKELCEAITGLLPVDSGRVHFIQNNGVEVEITNCDPHALWDKGVRMGFVPEDRLGMGLVAGLDMVDNMMLKSYNDKPGFFVDRNTPRQAAEAMIRQLNIVTPGVETPVRLLSGGNVQKVLLGREILFNPAVLIVAYPVRGLDINSSFAIYDLLNEQKKKGVAILFIGEDLDVLLQLSDRLLVLCGGQQSLLEDARGLTKERVGLHMTQLRGTAAEGEVKA